MNMEMADVPEIVAIAEIREKLAQKVAARYDADPGRRETLMELLALIDIAVCAEP